MVAWKNSLKPVEMAQVASYLLQFQGTTPANPKEAEGEIWIDPHAAVEAPAVDSVKIEVEVDTLRFKRTIDEGGTEIDMKSAYLFNTVGVSRGGKKEKLT